MALKYSISDKTLTVKRYHSGEKVTDLCAELNISKSTPYNGIKQYDITSTKTDGSPVTARTVYLLEKRIKNWNRSWKYGNAAAVRWIHRSTKS